MLCTDQYGYLVQCAPAQAASGPSTTTIAFVICVWALSVFLAAKLSQSKGYGTAVGVIGGICLGVIAVIFYALIPAKKLPETTSTVAEGTQA